MSIKVLDFKLPPPKEVDAELVARLELLLAKAKTGEVEHVVLTYLLDDDYKVIQHGPPKDCLLMATLLHRAAVNSLYVSLS